MIRAGVPAALITTSVFRGLAESERQAKGAPDLPLLVIDHPLGGERAEAVALRAGQAMAALSVAAGRIAAGDRG